MTYEERLDFILQTLPESYQTEEQIYDIDKKIDFPDKSDLLSALHRHNYTNHFAIRIGNYNGTPPTLTDIGKHFMRSTGGFAAQKQKEDNWQNAIQRTDRKTFWILVISIVAAIAVILTLFHDLLSSAH